MAETNKELLDQPSKPSLFEGLLVGNNDSAPRPQKKKTLWSGDEKGGVLTTEAPKSQVLGKIKDFLGVMAKANEKLQSDAQGTSRSDFDIEVLDGNEQEYIEMDLLLGVADLHTPEAVTAAEATIGSSIHPSVASTNSSSSSDTEDDSDEDDDSDNDKVANKSQENSGSENSRLQDSNPDNKPNKRPKIVVLN